MTYRHRGFWPSGAIANLIFQSRCPLCDRSAAAALCPMCQRQVRRCQYPSRQGFWQSTLPVFPWGQYSGALRRSLAALKYEHQPQIAQQLGGWLAEAWLTSTESARLGRRRLVVVPVPMYAEKRRQRGYDQAVLLAQQFCATARLPLRQQGLIRERATTAQFGLSVGQREANVSGAFRVDPALLKSGVKSDVSVLLLDDIYTTGATARAAADALRRSALPVLGLLAVAAPQLNTSR